MQVIPHLAALLLGVACTTAYAAKWEGEYGSSDAACRSRLDEDQIKHAGSQSDGPRVAKCFCQDKEGKFPKWHCNTVTQGPEEADEEQPTAEEKKAEQAAQKTAACKEIAGLFDQTLKEELPSNALQEAVVAVAKVVSANGDSNWIAGSSAFYGAPYGIGYTASGALSGSKYNYYARGIRTEEEVNPGSYVTKCGTLEKYQYPKNNVGRRYQGHAEAKIIEDWFKLNPKPGSTLYIEIRGTWDEPCKQCGLLVDFVNHGGDDCPKVVVCPSTQTKPSSSAQ